MLLQDSQAYTRLDTAFKLHGKMLVDRLENSDINSKDKECIEEFCAFIIFLKINVSSLVALCLSNFTSAIYEVTEDVNHSKCIEIFFMKPQIFLCEKKVQ